MKFLKNKYPKRTKCSLSKKMNQSLPDHPKGREHKVKMNKHQTDRKTNPKNQRQRENEKGTIISFGAQSNLFRESNGHIFQMAIIK